MLAGALIGQTGVNTCPWTFVLGCSSGGWGGKWDQQSFLLPPQVEQAGSTRGVRAQEAPWPEAVLARRALEPPRGAESRHRRITES